MFQNRDEAAQLLGERLKPYQKEKPLVLGIPRGGVPMAAIVAKALEGELDVVLVHKLGAPMQPELAIGAVHESGEVYLSPVAQTVGASKAMIQEEIEHQLKMLSERRRLYTPARHPIDPKDRVVIVVDDGSATGATMMSALRAVRAQHARKLISAMAVAPPATVEKLRELADEVVCLSEPEDFFAVGQFFADFSAVSDKEVVGLLKRFSKQA